MIVNVKRRYEMNLNSYIFKVAESDRSADQCTLRLLSLVASFHPLEYVGPYRKPCRKMTDGYNSLLRIRSHVSAAVSADLMACR